MRRPKYREAVRWIVDNDEGSEISPEVVEAQISTLLVADLFGIEPERVAQDVIRIRMKERYELGVVRDVMTS